MGSLPFAYKLLGFLVGFRGDKETGIRTLRLVAQKGHFNRVDAEVLLAAIYRRERRAKDALPLLADLIRRYPRNFLPRFETARMCSEIGDTAATRRILKQRGRKREPDLRAPWTESAPVGRATPIPGIRFRVFR